MREIKFRAWDNNQKKMAYIGDGSPFTLTYGTIVDMFEDEDLMQYTGLKDKNKREIYEGDIVKAIATKEFKENTIISDIISSEPNSGAWEVRSTREAKHGLHLKWGSWKSIEIIGNIYENSDLLQ